MQGVRLYTSNQYTDWSAMGNLSPILSGGRGPGDEAFIFKPSLIEGKYSKLFVRATVDYFGTDLPTGNVFEARLITDSMDVSSGVAKWDVPYPSSVHGAQIVEKEIDLTQKNGYLAFMLSVSDNPCQASCNLRFDEAYLVP